MSNVLQVLLYGLLAAASPGTVVATLAVLGTKRARVNGSVFAVGFVLGQALALFFVIAIGSVTTPSGGDSTASASPGDRRRTALARHCRTRAPPL